MSESENAHWLLFWSSKDVSLHEDRPYISDSPENSNILPVMPAVQVQVYRKQEQSLLLRGVHWGLNCQTKISQRNQIMKLNPGTAQVPNKEPWWHRGLGPHGSLRWSKGMSRTSCKKQRLQLSHGIKHLRPLKLAVMTATCQMIMATTSARLLGDRSQVYPHVCHTCSLLNTIRAFTKTKWTVSDCKSSEESWQEAKTENTAG